MERRVLLAFFLSFLVLFVYQSLVVPPEPPPSSEAVNDEAAKALFPDGWDTVKPYLRKVKDPTR